MRISDAIRALALGCAVGVMPAVAVAFEVKDGAAEATPARALPALPGLAAPSVPDFGVDRSMRDAWRSFLHSYRSGDKKAALKQLQAAADQGDILAQWKLGRMHADGDGIPQDHYKAFQLFSKIADTRPDESRDSPHAGVVANAFVALGHYWLEGIPQSQVKPHAAHAAKAFNYAAVYFGHPEAQYQLARMLLDGQVGKSDPRMAARWLNQAAEKGHISAQAILGRMLYLGESMPRHSWKGLMWLKVARENASGKQEAWVAELHQRAHDQATDEDRRIAAQHAQRFLRASMERRGNLTAASPSVQ